LIRGDSRIAIAEQKEETMGLATVSYVDSLIRAELITTPIGTNHDIYDNRLTAPYPSQPFRYIPRRVYFYYLTLDHNNSPTVEHYLYDHKTAAGDWLEIKEADLDAILIKLMRNARTTKTDPPVSGYNFVGVEWRHRSYIAVVIDEQGWKFQKRSDGKTAAAFNLSKGSTPNHSFFDAVDRTIDVDGDARHAIAFINHMKKDSDGTDLDSGPGQPFQFDIYIDIQYRGSTDFITVILDPGGTNQGPPLEP
jgi:hypothetical protein